MSTVLVPVPSMATATGDRHGTGPLFAGGREPHQPHLVDRTVQSRRFTTGAAGGERRADGIAKDRVRRIAEMILHPRS